MTQNQIRFVRTLTATWKVLRDPVLTTIYMKKWKNRKDKMQTIYGFVFREMYKAAWCPTRKMTATTERYILVGDDSNHGRARTGTETRRIYPFIQCCSVWFSGRNMTTERYILVVDITNHGQARMNTETRNIYPWFRVVPWSSVVET